MTSYATLDKKPDKKRYFMEISKGFQLISGDERNE